MFKGFYNLTSGMLSQGRRLDVVSHNMTNISTAGYKLDRYTDSTFQDVLISRVGNKNKAVSTEMGEETYILAPSELVTDFTQGSMEETTLPLDFAIVGDGFFAVQDPEGNVGYTRMGNFSLDDEGYLCLPGFGQVLDPQSEPIYLGTDKIRGDSRGVIYFDQPPEQGGGTAIGQLGVFSFEDNLALERNDRGLFTGEGAQQSEDFEIWNQYLERSNTDMIKQMTEMITYQRALQSAAQVTKMYDQLMTKATGEVGRLN